MTRWRTSPTIRDRKIPTATDSAPERAGVAPPELAVAVPGRGASGVTSVNVFVGRLDAERAARFLHQKRLDEHVDVAFEDAVHVADLIFRAVVFDELIRMQHV